MSSGFAIVSTDPDVRLFYTVTPPQPIDPARPVVVLSNALLATTALWDGLVDALAATHTVVRYDARFHGQSPLSATAGYDYSADLVTAATATGGLTVDDLADDVLAVLAAAGVPSSVKPSFVGLSIGAAVGLSLAARYGATRFDRFVLVATRAHADGTADAARLAARADLIRTHGGPRAQAEASVRRWFPPGWTAAHPAAAAALAAQIAQAPVEALTASGRALATLDVRPAAAAVGQRVPSAAAPHHVLFAVGADDDARVVAETQALAALAGSRVAVVADCGHMVPVQQPAALLALVRSFLDVEGV